MADSARTEAPQISIGQTERLGAPLGLRVDGVDVRTLDDETFLDLHRLFLEHHVLAISGQELTPDEQIAFGARWGELMPFPYGGLPSHPEIIPLLNSGKRRDVNQHWHSDMSYEAIPPKLSMLYCLEAPEIGGDTAFANQHLAYEELSLGLRNVVDQLQAEHSAAGVARIHGADPKDASRATHPVVRTHDETGRKALYVCKAFVDRFADWSMRDSVALLGHLFEHGSRPEFQARVRWSAGDLVMWDNRSVQHFAVHDHGDDQRLIHRLQVRGTTPV
ncbi:MAG: TauD/TfdA dioxygenase family protein [Acidimicrobiales bacterium]|jgi:taurine dioxygenase